MTDRSIRVCSYNVRCDVSIDEPTGEPAWEERRPRLLETIRRLEPDLLGLQEPRPHQYEELRESLEGSGYEVDGVGRRDGDRVGEFVPIAWRGERFDPVETGVFWLSETPDEPSVGWDGACPRIATWATLCDRETDRHLWFCNTHLDHRGERARRESARLLRDRVESHVDEETTAVVTGDFNGTPDSEPIRTLTDGSASEDSLVDTRAVASRTTGPEGTFHGFTDSVDGRIDYVFVSEDLTVQSYRTGKPRDGAYRSDHVPVVVTLE